MILLIQELKVFKSWKEMDVILQNFQRKQVGPMGLFDLPSDFQFVSVIGSHRVRVCLQSI